MADVKISGLPNATTPVAGTEVLPIVQGGQTRKVSVDNLTAGKAVSALSVTATTVSATTLTRNGGSVPYLAHNLNIPFFLCSSGTMGNNGAVTGLTALPFETSYGASPNAYVYMPANAISAGSAAGWYYAVFSSPTACTLYNNVYTSGVPTIPSSPTAFVTTGPGAFTQTTGSFINGPVILIPALTSNSVIRLGTFFLTNNSANAKNASHFFGGQNIQLNTFSTTTTTTMMADFVITNKNATNRQFTRVFSGTSTLSVGTPSPSSVDTSVANQNLVMRMLLNNATDVIAFYNGSIEVFL